MNIVVIILASLISCFIFGKTRIGELSHSLVKSYTVVAGLMKEKMSDDLKQKKIIEQTFVQFKLIGWIAGQILMILSPFIVAWLCYRFLFPAGIHSLFTVQSTIISLLTVLVWILVKKNAKQ
jgi:hypothetical protein